MGSRERPDHYALKARKEGYPARSVYKLEEMQKKYQLFKPGFRVLDIGASPGSWTLYVLRQIKEKGSVVSADLKPLELKKKFANLHFFQGDVFLDETVEELRKKGPYHTVISDAAPSTTGNRIVDTRRSFELVEQILSLAEKLLKPGGSFVVKVFQGGDEEELFARMKGEFQMVKRFKPKAVRSESFETYFIGRNFQK